MPFATLCNRDGSGYIAIPKDDLRLEGLLDENGDLTPNQEMHIQHAGEGTFIVRTLNNGGLKPLEDCAVVQRAAADLMVKRTQIID